MRSALGLIPTAPSVLVDIAVGRRILVPICGLSRGSVIAVRARCGDTLAALRSLYRSYRSLRGGLMLRVRRVAVLGDDGASVVAISVGRLVRSGVGPGIWVVGLTDLLAAIRRHG